jgi:hypothetical protein
MAQEVQQAQEATTWGGAVGASATGVFALLGVGLTWLLRRKDDAVARKAENARAKRAELVELYAEAMSALEQAIKCAHQREAYDITEDRSLLNAKIRLLGTEAVNFAYDDAAGKLHTWSRLHAQASPQRMKVGDHEAVIFQSPDPTAKYLLPAQEAHKAMHDAIKLLREHMQAHIGEC